MSSATGSITVDGKEWFLPDIPMDTVYEPDKGGNSLKFQRIDGKNYLRLYIPEIMRSVKTQEMREGDVCLCAFPRTGTHWVFEIICMLLNRNTETIQKHKGQYHIELHSQETLEAIPSPRPLNSHLCMSELPSKVVEKKCKVIYNVRDPKDVAVSLYNMYRDTPISEYKGEFKDFLYLFLDVKNRLQEVQKLSDFMGLKRDDRLCQAIAEKCAFPRMAEDKDKYCIKFGGKNSLYRKGVVGDWKNWFTDQMLEDYYKVYEDKMAGSRFYERYAKTRSQFQGMQMATDK